MTVSVPQGWITLVHPEGFRYFVNQGKVSQVHELSKTDGLSWSYTRREHSHR
jgi:hypothetical protein